MSESKPKSDPIADPEILGFCEDRRRLLAELAPMLRDVSSATPRRQKAVRFRRARRKELRKQIQEVDSFIISRVMELTDDPDSGPDDEPNNILMWQLKKSVEMTKPKGGAK